MKKNQVYCVGCGWRSTRAVLPERGLGACTRCGDRMAPGEHRPDTLTNRRIDKAKRELAEQESM
jgi:hypothetical protein